MMIEKRKDNMKEITLKVDGMVCNGCENRVVNALKTLEGIKEVEASFKNGIVTVKGNVEKEKLEEKIEDLGFKVVKE